MKCIVTGGAGFIGSHLVDRLLKEGHKVTVIDDFSTGRLQNLAEATAYKENDLQIVPESILNLQKIDGMGLFGNADWVFHLAGKADIVPSITNPLLYFETNVTGTVNVLELCRKYQVKKIVYAASSSCYGDVPPVSPYSTSEEDRCAPRYPYALTKYLGEQCVLHWGKLYSIPYCSLRLFNVFGLRSRTTGAYGAVIGTFLKQKLENQPLTIVGDGVQSRDFTHVSDVVDAFYRAAYIEGPLGIINIGTGRPHTINYLSSLISNNRTHIIKRPGEPKRTCADIYKAKRHLEWKPRTTFEDGIRELLENIEDFRDAPLWTPEKIKEATKEWFKYLG